MPATPWGEAHDVLARRLRPGPGASREVVARDQRDRLFAALAVLADERGYAALRVEDLIARAGISRGAFYALYASRDDCLAAAVASIVDTVLGEADSGRPPRANGARGAAATQPPAALDAVEALTGQASRQPAATSLWLVDAFGAGPPAVEQAERGADRLRTRMALAPNLPAPLASALAGGLWRVVARRLRLRQPGELNLLAEPLREWLRSYGPPPEPLRRPGERSRSTAGPRFTPQDQVERIILGTCEAVYEKGYAATTLADIARHAATSIRTFYAHYQTKEEAFVDAVDLAQVQSDAAARAAARRAPDWSHAVRDAIGAVCGYFANEPTLAEAVVVEVRAAGETALRRRDEWVETVARLLEPGYQLAPDTHPVASEAIAWAIDALLNDAVRAGGGPKLRAAAPAAAYLALSPFVGAETACAVANSSGQPRRRSA